VFLDDAVGDGEAKACAAAVGLGGEKRIVDTRDVLGRDARTGVRHFHGDRVAGGGSGHRQPSTLRHGITRVEKQIQEHLLQLVLETPNRRRRSQIPTHLDPAAAELVLEQRQYVTDDRIEVERRRLALGRPRQVQQAVDDLGGAEGLPLDLLQQLGPGISRVCFVEQHLGEARDARERRVDLVRHAGSQQADRRHLLGDAQLFLKACAVGNVLDHDDPAGLGPVGGLKGRDAGVHKQRPRKAGRTGCQRCAQQRGALGRLAPRRHQQFHKRRRKQRRDAAADGAGAIKLEHLLQSAVPAQHPIVEIDDEQAVAQRLHDAVAELAQALDFIRLHAQLPI